jgi:hypothetical protein
MNNNGISNPIEDGWQEYIADMPKLEDTATRLLYEAQRLAFGYGIVVAIERLYGKGLSVSELRRYADEFIEAK